MEAIIIGSGPAGLEAALNLKIRNKSFLIFGSDKLSPKLEAAPRIDNYLGFYGITGVELRDRMKAHLEKMEIKITPERVSAVYPMGGYFSVATNKNVYESEAVILAGGVSGSSELPGEKDFLGHGVGYCATCDAPLYRGKAVVILGYSADSAEEANFVSEIAAKVYFLPLGKYESELSDSIEIVNGKPEAIRGSLKAEALVLDSGTELKADGFFILRDSVAPQILIPGLETENGYVVVDTAMRTNIEGCFAAGDCTGKPHQYMRAAGQGQIAALSAAAYLSSKKENEK